MFVRLTNELGDPIWVNPGQVAAIKTQNLVDQRGVRTGVGALLIIGIGGELTGEPTGITVRHTVDEVLSMFDDGHDQSNALRR